MQTVTGRCHNLGFRDVGRMRGGEANRRSLFPDAIPRLSLTSDLPFALRICEQSCPFLVFALSDDIHDPHKAPKTETLSLLFYFFICSYVCILIYLFFYGTGIGTQELAHGRQVFYRGALPPQNVYRWLYQWNAIIR